MSTGGELFLDQVRQAQRLNSGILTMPSHTDARMDAETSNRLTWVEFRDRIRPMGVLDLQDAELECLVIPKNIGWSTRDVTIFAGEQDSRIHEIDDLNTNQGTAFLGINSFLAEELLKHGEELVQVSIGFNPQDFSIGHHTNAKLHSHIRAVPHAIDLERRQPLTWGEMRRFDRLAFIEPFAPLHHDFISSKIADGILSDFLIMPATSNLGFTSLSLSKSLNLGYAFPDLKKLYADMKEEYEIISSIFTDGSRDELGRFIPRPLQERLEFLDTFLDNRTIYGDSSVRVLEYLAQNIKQAKKRGDGDPYDMTSTAMIYITRGFAGAITLNFSAGRDDIVLDFLPRVISTTPVGKTILGAGLPTVINKTVEPANKIEKAVTNKFHQTILGILKAEFGDSFELTLQR